MPLDEARADELFRMAAKGQRDQRTAAGLPNVQEILNFVSAPKFDRKGLIAAAKSGDQKAQYILGHLHMNGWGTPQDYVTAYAWLNLATAKSGETIVRDTLTKRMTASQINAGQALARDLEASISAGE